MILKETLLSIVDSTGVRVAKTFHLYGGFSRKSSSLGYYVKGSVRVVKKKPKNPHLKKKFFRKGNVIRLFVCRNRYTIARKDSSNLFFNENSSIVFKKKNTFYSNHTVGPITSEINKKRFLLLFKDRI